MPDGGADFTLRLINQVTKPARDVKRAVESITKAVRTAQRSTAAPAARRSPLSAFDQSSRGARRAMAADQAKNMLRLQKQSAIQQVRAAKEKARLDKQASVHMAKQAKLAQEVKGARMGGFDAQDLLSGATLGGIAAIGAATVAAAAAVAYLAFKFGEATVAAAAFAQRSRMALQFLIGHAPVAAVEFDAVRKEAQRLGLDVESTQHSFQKLLAAQFQIGKAKELIRMGSDLQAIGATQENVEGVLLAITQIKAKGRLMAQEMLQLQERGISSELVYEALGRRLGKTTEQLKKLQEKGKLGGTVAIESILEAVRVKTGVSRAGEAGEMFAATTLTGMFNTLKAGVTNFFIDVGDAVMPGIMTIVGLIRGTIGKITGDPEIGNVGKFLINRFELFVMWVQSNWPTIESVIVGGLRLVGDAIRFSVEAVDFMAAHWNLIKPVLIGVGVIFGVLAVGAATLVAGMYLVVAAVLAAIGAITAAVGYLAGLAVDAYNWGSGLVDGFINGVKARLQGAIDTVTGLVNQVKFAITGPGGLAMHSPSEITFMYGENFVQGFIGGLGANDNALMGATASMSTAALRGLGGEVASGSGATSRSLTIAEGAIVVNLSGSSMTPQSVGGAVVDEISRYFSEAV